MKKLRFISLFAGIGGFDLGFERADMQCVAQVEKEKKSLKTLSHHWPDVPKFDDVCTVGKLCLPECDVICGGFPCQDLSIAGKRSGLAGKRSGLFYEMGRITNELRPSILVWENVGGLLSSNRGIDFLSVLSELDRIGYCGGWTVLDARFFGVAQRRRRVFGVFVRRDIAEMGRYVGNGELPDGAGIPSVAGKILAFPNRLRWNPKTGRSPGQENRPDIAGCLKTSNPTRGASCVNNNHIITTGTLTARAMQSYGREMVEEGFTIAFSHSDNGRDSTVNLSPTLRASNNANSNQHGNGHLSVVDFRNYLESTDVTQTLQSKSNGGYSLNYIPSVNGGKKVRRITPVECERLQGFPDDFTKINSDSTRYSQLGNAVALPVVEWIGKGIVSVMEQIYK